MPSVRDRNPTSTGLEVGDGRDQVAQVPAETIQAPYDEGVTRTEVVEDLSELGTVVEGAAGRVGPIRMHPAALRASVWRWAFCSIVLTRA